MNNEQDIHDLELTIEQARKLIERRNAFVRLQNNFDFKTIIEDGFMKDHAIRQVMLKSHPGLQDEKQQNMMDTQITAIGGLKQYFINLNTEGLNAEQAVESDQRTLEELHSEGLVE